MCKLKRKRVDNRRLLVSWIWTTLAAGFIFTGLEWTHRPLELAMQWGVLVAVALTGLIFVSVLATEGLSRLERHYVRYAARVPRR